MKIGILSFAQHSNYGGILQSYALQTVLERMGHEVVIFNQKMEDNRLSFVGKIVHYPVRLIRKYILRQAVEHINLEDWNYNKLRIYCQNLETFISKHWHSLYIDSFSDIRNEYNALIVGSDQVWRPKYFRSAWHVDDISDSFLAFARNWKVKRIAFAASFGVDNLEYTDAEVAECRPLAEKFDAVSVREESAIELCRRYFGCDAKWVVDPTMLLSADDYLSIASGEEDSKSDYLLRYVLDKSQFAEKLINDTAADKHLDVKEIRTYGTNEDKPWSLEPVEKWLGDFAHAKFVVTDSFHGCVFSIIFHRQFAVVLNKDRGQARIHSLLKMFNLEDRLVPVGSDYKNLPDIDYTAVDKILAEKRQEAISFLKDNLG